jgi:hypothetical protein
MWDRNSGHGLCINLLPEIHIMYLYTHCWEQMKSVGGHGSLSLQFVMKVMVWHFVSHSHKVMAALTHCCYLQIVVVEISLQLHGYMMRDIFSILLVWGHSLYLFSGGTHSWWHATGSAGFSTVSRCCKHGEMHTRAFGPWGGCVVIGCTASISHHQYSGWKLWHTPRDAF